jgi:RimJ/RimL family protein N-acetyltransferase
VIDLDFIPLDETGLYTLESWFNDAELGYRYAHPTRIWLDYVRLQPGVYAWMILESGVPVGHLQLDTQDNASGYIGFVVNPKLRNRGYGQRILHAFLARPEARHLGRILGMTEVDNVASHRCMEAVGFQRQDGAPDEEGFLTFVYTRKRAAD